MRLVFTSDGVGVAIRSVEIYGIVKTAFWFRLRFHRLRSSENWVVGVASRSGRTKPSVGTCIVTGLSFRFCFRLRFQAWEHALWLVCPSASASDSDSVALMTRLATPIFDVQKVICAPTAPRTTPIPTPLPVNPFFRPVHTRGMLRKRGTGNGERGTSIGNGKTKNWKQNLTWNLALSATSFCSQFSSSLSPCWFPVPRSPFPVPRFSNIHASQSLDRKNTTDFVFRSKRELNVYHLVLKRL